MMGSLDYARRKLVVTTSPTKRSADFIEHLRLLDHLYGPKPGAPFKPVVLVLDNGPIHVSKAAHAALAERAHWLAVEWLPKYAPELNDIEIVWGDLKARHLAHQTFTDPDVLDQAIPLRRRSPKLAAQPHSVGQPTNLCLERSPVCLGMAAVRAKRTLSETRCSSASGRKRTPGR